MIAVILAILCLVFIVLGWFVDLPKPWNDVFKVSAMAITVFLMASMAVSSLSRGYL